MVILGQGAETGIVVGLKGAITQRRVGGGAGELEPRVLELPEAPQGLQPGQPWWESC